ncbi:MAG: hypothetical protein LBV04_05650 [Deferribacteraceae bacterium]|jgi:hypothetical protein|nr:hypothetical protein [Deferribacteraceae bacterium]
MQKQQIKISLIPNPFEPAKRHNLELDYAPIALSELLVATDIVLAKHVPIVNGATVGWDFVPAIDDDIIIVPNIAGGNNATLGGVLMAAGIVIGVVTGWTGVGAAVGMAMVTTGAGMIVGELLKPKVPNVSPMAPLENNSSTYGFEGIHNSTGESIPLPLVYGRHRIGGVLLEASVDSNTTSAGAGTGQLLSIVLGLSEGEIGGIVHKDGKPEIYVNDQPLGYFGNGIWWSERKGTMPQEPLSVSRMQHQITELNPTTSYTYTAKSFNATGFTLCFTQDARTAIDMVLPYLVKIDTNINGTWTSVTRQMVDAEATYYVENPQHNIRQLRVTMIDGKFVKVVEDSLINENLAQIKHYYSIQGVKLNSTQRYIYPIKNKGIARVRVGLMFPALYNTDEAGKILETSVLFSFYRSSTGKDGSWIHCGDTTAKGKARAKIVHDMDFAVDMSTAYIMVTRATSSSSNFTLVNDSYVQSVTEIENVTIAYNNTALLGLRIEPTDRLSGALPNVTAVIDGIKIASVREIVNNQDYSRHISSNPADIIYDMLTNQRYGLGRYLLPDRIDMDSLLAFAEWCDEPLKYDAYDARTGTYSKISEPRYRLNIVLDSEMSAADALATICKSTRCMAYWHGDKLRFKLDREAVPRQLFGMANIVQDSYMENYIGLAEIPNQIEARFLDEADNYKQHTVSAYDSSRIDELVNAKTINLYGTTSYAQVKRELVYALKKVRSIRRFISFEAGIEGVAVEVGDVILFSHDTPQYGYSGRVKSTEDGKIHLDKIIDTAIGARYTAVFGTGAAVLRHDFVATAEELQWLDMSAEQAQEISAGMPYALGLLQKEAIPLRVLSLKQTSRFTVRFECEEYNESIYTLSEDIVVDIPDYSDLGTGHYVVDGDSVLPLPSNPTAGMADIPSRIEQISARELVEERHGGGVCVAVVIDWEPSTLPTGSISRIEYYAVLVANSGQWHTAGTTKAQTFTLPDVAIGEPLQIAIKPYTMYGVTNNDLNIVSITPTGQVPLALAPKITHAVQNGKYVQIKWQAVTNTVVSHYEIRQGKDWAFARKLNSSKAYELITPAPSSSGLVSYLVAAIDVNGLRGAIASCTVDICREDGNMFYRLDSKANGWEGAYINVLPVADALTLTASEGCYTMAHLDIQELSTAAISIDYDIAGFSDPVLRWEDLPVAWVMAGQKTWNERTETDCVEHSHEIALFTSLNSDIADVIRFAESTSSLNGIVPTIDDDDRHQYEYSTLHKGLKRDEDSEALIYPLASPEQWTWSVYFRYSLRGSHANGLLARLGEASIIGHGDGSYSLSAEGGTISLITDSVAELLVCVSVQETTTYFAIGDSQSGDFASARGEIGFRGFEQLAV